MGVRGRQKNSGLPVMQDYDLEGRIFRSTRHARKILFLAYFASYLKSNPFDC